MATDRKLRRSKPVRRPKKCARERRRRMRQHKKRLIAAGWDLAVIERMDRRQILAALRQAARKTKKTA